jgi:hypothetical protein
MKCTVCKFCSVVFGITAFVAPVLIVRAGPRNQACGLCGLTMLAFTGSSMIGLFLVAYAFEGSAELARNPRRPPDMLRALAASWAKDANFGEAIRWQTEALRFASSRWKAEYQAELERYQHQQGRAHSRPPSDFSATGDAPS